MTHPDVCNKTRTFRPKIIILIHLNSHNLGATVTNTTNFKAKVVAQ